MNVDLWIEFIYIAENRHILVLKFLSEVNCHRRSAEYFFFRNYLVNSLNVSKFELAKV